jgi:hypothetical protein
MGNGREHQANRRSICSLPSCRQIPTIPHPSRRLLEGTAFIVFRPLRQTQGALKKPGVPRLPRDLLDRLRAMR